MTRLALDCSTARGSAALAADDGEVIWRAEFPAGRGHGGRLFAALATAIPLAGTLAEIVVGLGPGSYSGVRQTIAVATGLSAATGARLTGLPSPLALATATTAYQAIGDARRGAFYYTAVEAGVCVVGPELLETRAALIARFAQRLGWPVFLVECTLDADLSAFAIPALPLAERLLAIPPSQRRPTALEPIYLRPPAITLRPPSPGTPPQ